MTRWFAASLLFRSIHSGNQCVDGALWEESVRLISAESVEEAQKKAEVLGRDAEVNYAVSENDNVRWIFVQIERIYEIQDEEIVHGSELFSRFLRQSEVESLLKPFD
jgi:hypothetical protein